jgi:hypothetical protein
MREQGKYGNSVGPRIFGEDKADRLLKHGVVGQDQARFKDISWIKHGIYRKSDGKIEILAKSGKVKRDQQKVIDILKRKY